jgi:hypothetical protein
MNDSESLPLMIAMGLVVYCAVLVARDASAPLKKRGGRCVGLLRVLVFIVSFMVFGTTVMMFFAKNFGR